MGRTGPHLPVSVELVNRLQFFQTLHAYLLKHLNRWTATVSPLALELGVHPIVDVTSPSVILLAGNLRLRDTNDNVHTQVHRNQKLQL